MKRFILILAIMFAANFAKATNTTTVSFNQVYREMQTILYGEYGGSQTGIEIANAYLMYWYHLDCCSIWFLHDACGYTGNITIID